MHRFTRATLLSAAAVVGALLTASAAAADQQVYTSTNEAAGNRVLVYHRAGDGTLGPSGSVATGGLGTGGGLSNQGAVQKARRLLFVTDAASNDVAVLRLRDGAPTLVDRAPSGGQTPTRCIPVSTFTCTPSAPCPAAASRSRPSLE